MTPAKYYALCVLCRVMPAAPGIYSSAFLKGKHDSARRELMQYFKDNPSTKADRLHRRAKFSRVSLVVLYLDAHYLDRFESGAWIDTPALGRLVVEAGVIEIKNDDEHQSKAKAEAMDAVNIWKEINNLYQTAEELATVLRGDSQRDEVRP